MRKNNMQGFTLVELMTVLVIVGVLMALALAMLARINGTSHNGFKLGRAIEQVELGCQNLIQDFNMNQEGASFAETLNALEGDDFAFTAQRVALYSGATSTGQDGYYKFNKNPGEIFIDNPIAMVQEAEDPVVIDPIVIDVDGFNDGQNRDGIDRFYFRLRDSGKLEPYGLNSYQNDCPTNGTITDGRACTARVIADGFDINIKANRAPASGAIVRNMNAIKAETGIKALTEEFELKRFK